MPPYYSKDREKLFHTIKTEQVKFPNFLSKEAVDILTKLFIKDPEKRLGSGPNGLEDIKSQPFFSSINWDSILEKKIKPPFTPKLRSETDTRYIDPDFTSLAPTDSYHAGESLNDIKSHPFFSSINWDSILEKKIKPPFTPKLRSETDTRYIDPEFTSLTAMDSYHAGESLGDNENPFVGFSYDANKEEEKQQENPQI